GRPLRNLVRLATGRASLDRLEAGNAPAVPPSRTRLQVLRSADTVGVPTAPRPPVHVGASALVLLRSSVSSLASSAAIAARGPGSVPRLDSPPERRRPEHPERRRDRLGRGGAKVRPAAPVRKDLVLLGGGHSHVTVLRRFGMRPMPGVRLTLIGREIHTPYSGMLPGLIAGHYDFDDCHIDLAPLALFAGARLFHDEVTGIDPARRLVHCARRPPVPYDVVSINTGSTPAMRDVRGAVEHAVPVKPISRFLSHWEDVAERVVGSSGRCRIGVVGAGAGGVELLLAVRHRLRTLLAEKGDAVDRLDFVLVGDSPRLLPRHPESTRR